ncbi:LysR family transcriptional regulator [Acidovorax sp.]|uniref:LysR family transcriptional regulator n=1 Tax=Acidovorax sp. TaxID=1872122 RepID=UPI002FAAF20B
MDQSPYLFFAEVVEAGSFAMAARRLGMDRSNVSRRIKELEHTAGVQLMRRTTRKMVLTDLGAAFYEQCLAVRSEIEQAKNLLLSHGDGVRGPLHVSCPPAIGRLYLVSVFEAFCRRYPAVSLQITLKSGAVDLIDERIDVAIRFTNEPSPHQVARVLGQTHWIFCASPDYLAEHGTPQFPEDLAHHAWLGMRTRMELQLRKEAALHRVVLRSRVACPDYALLGQMARDGLGVCLLPVYVASRGLPQGGLAQVLADYQVEPTPGSTLYAMTLPGIHSPPQVKAFVQFLAETVQAEFIH